MNRLFIILGFALLSFTAIAQEEITKPSFDDGQKLNTLNSNGQKEGLWIIEDTWPGCIAYISYHNGVRDGLSFTHHEANTLSWVEYSVMGDLQVAIDFSDGKGSWKTYPPGTVMGIDYCSRNTEFSIKQADGSSTVPYNKAYSVAFYPDGSTKSEGFIVWDKEEDLEIDFRECGVWKYYDSEKGITFKKYSDEPASIQEQRNENKASLYLGREVNQYNSDGQKEGVWVENNLPECVSYITYQKGKRHGLSFMRHLPTNTILWIEYSENGELKTSIRLSDGTNRPAGTVLSIHFGKVIGR